MRVEPEVDPGQEYRVEDVQPHYCYVEYASTYVCIWFACFGWICCSLYTAYLFMCNMAVVRWKALTRGAAAHPTEIEEHEHIKYLDRQIN